MRLVPARPEPDAERPAYMPRIAWPWVLFGVLGVATLTGGYLLKERARAGDLRAQILRVHEYELAEPAQRYRAFRDKLENWILRAAWSRPREYVDPRLRITGLRAGSGLYLRLYARDARTRRDIAEGARSMDADAIPSCLGLAPTSARGVWEKGEFLTAKWADQVRKEQSVMRLRVIDEMLARGIRSDLPGVLALTGSQWFMLVLQAGETRRDHPVDVFLWDVRRDELLLRSRLQARGLLVPMHIAVAGAPPGARAPQALTTGGATDCSIASQLKALTGTPEAQVQAAAVSDGATTAPGAAGPAQGSLSSPDAGGAGAPGAPSGDLPPTGAGSTLREGSPLPAGAAVVPPAGGGGAASPGAGASEPPKSP